MIEIKKNKDGKHYFRVKAKNGEILCHSEIYESKQGCEQAVQALVKVLIEELSTRGFVTYEERIDEGNEWTKIYR